MLPLCCVCSTVGVTPVLQYLIRIYCCLNCMYTLYPSLETRLLGGGKAAWRILFAYATAPNILESLDNEQYRLDSADFSFFILYKLT